MSGFAIEGSKLEDGTSKMFARANPGGLGTMARRRGLDLDGNPFWLGHEATERRAWADAWSNEHIRLGRQRVAHAPKVEAEIEKTVNAMNGATS